MKLPQKWDQVCKDEAVASNAMDGEGWKDEGVLARLTDMKGRCAARREYIHSPMLSLAFATDPAYHGVDMTAIDGGRVMVDLKIMFERLLVDHGTDAAAAIRAAREEEDGGPASRAMQ